MAINAISQRYCAKNPPIDGFCHPDFHTVETALRKPLPKYTGGAAVCVYHRGECVADLWGGYRDENGNPWREDTMAPSFSTTKGVSSTLLHIFADRGLIDYDEKVSAYWPEFAQAGKEAITVRQVLCHQSGLYHIRQMIDRAPRMLDWEHMIEAIEKATPAHQPGARTGYHGLTYGFVVGELVQRVSGKKFSDLVQSEIAEPLGLDGLYIGTPEKELHRAAQLIAPGTLRRLPRQVLERYVELSIYSVSGVLRALGIDSHLSSFHDALGPRGMRQFDFGSAEALRAAIPAGNGLFTARSLARVFAMLAGGGKLDNVRLLSADAVKQASTVQTAPGKYAVIPFDMRWRLGYHGVYTTRGFQREAFGHFGFGGSGAWADPSQDLAVALIANSGTGSPFGDSLTARIGSAALASAKGRKVASAKSSRKGRKAVGSNKRKQPKFA
ncbi:MAG: serine hydrolase domain-containing protein [Pseudomonadales bacterium]